MLDGALYTVIARKADHLCGGVLMAGGPFLQQLAEAIEDEIKSRARAGDYRIDRHEVEDIGARVLRTKRPDASDVQERAARSLAVKEFLGMAGAGWTGRLAPATAGDPIPILKPPRPWDQPAWSTASFDAESEWFRETAPGGVG